MTAARQFREGWPEVESQVVIDAVRSVVSDPTSRPASERLLSEAGRRWADAHRSGTVMRARLEALGALLETEDEPDRSDYLAALRLVADAATWTSLDHLEREALVDPLTGAGNRRALDLTLEGAAGAALRLGFGLVVVAIDLDGLKRINDESGHRTGDRALIALVDALAGSVRASDTVFRTGGDEFVLVLQGTSLAETEPLLRRIAAAGAPSFSWGAAELTPDLRRPGDLVAAADDDLYRRRRAARRSDSPRTGPDGIEAAPDGIETDGPSLAAPAATVVSLTASDHAVLARLTSRRRAQPTPRSGRRRTLVAAAAAVVLVGGVAGAVAGRTSPPHARSASTAPVTGAGGAGPTGAPTTVPGPASPTTTTPAALHGAAPVATAAVVPGGRSRRHPDRRRRHGGSDRGPSRRRPASWAARPRRHRRRPTRWAAHRRPPVRRRRWPPLRPPRRHPPPPLSPRRSAPRSPAWSGPWTAWPGRSVRSSTACSGSSPGSRPPPEGKRFPRGG